MVLTLAECYEIIERWAECRCVLTRRPTDPCVCCRGPGGKWACDAPVKEPEEMTARDKAERRRQRKRGR